METMTASGINAAYVESVLEKMRSMLKSAEPTASRALRAISHL